MAEEELPRVDHKYISTACWHDLHSECRNNCKFCQLACLCRCHEWNN